MKIKHTEESYRAKGNRVILDQLRSQQIKQETPRKSVKIHTHTDVNATIQPQERPVVIMISNSNHNKIIYIQRQTAQHTLGLACREGTVSTCLKQRILNTDKMHENVQIAPHTTPDTNTAHQHTGHKKIPLSRL